MPIYSPTRTTFTVYSTDYKLYRREETTTTSGTESSTSSSSSHKSSSTKCGGKKCHYPSDHSNGATVGVAVGVPVAVCLVVFAVILVILYKRSKKEAQDDNDPEFEGDVEYMPHMGTYFPQIDSSNSGGSMEFKDDRMFQDTTPYYLPQQHISQPLNPFESSARSSRIRSVDPFQLPENIEFNALRDFAKQVDGPSIGGYHIASSSRNASHVSLPTDHGTNSMFMQDGGYQNNLQTCGLDFVRPEANPGFNRNSQISESTDNDTSLNSVLLTSPVKSVVGQANQYYSHDISGFDAEQSGIDLTVDRSIANDKYVQYPDARNILPDESFEFETTQEPELNSSKRNTEEDGEDKIYKFEYEDEEEDDENIQRMRSIYQVYLDRNETMKQASSQDTDNKLPVKQLDGPVNAQLGDSNLDGSNSSYAENTGTQGTQHLGEELQENVPIEAEEEKKHRRTVSSIYSEIPQLIDQPSLPQHQLQKQYTQEQYTQEQYPQEQYPQEQYPQEQYPTSSQQSFANQPQYYIQPVLVQHQYLHPQTFEEFEELPTPSQLAHSNTIDSLTSFNKPKQPQLTRLQTARLNGTALNPMDHPEMFYKKQGDQFSAYQQSISGTPTQDNSQNAPKPYQLRESIVMTDPSDLSILTTYKPAGSFRNISSFNSRNNSLMSQSNPYPQQQQQQQQINSRVSGLLDSTDVVQPPSVGDILPHSSSNEDLRKQLGHSSNYNIA